MLEDKELNSEIEKFLLKESYKSNVKSFIVCSPKIDIILKGSGGICSSCRTYFKIYTSLISHMSKCNI